MRAGLVAVLGLAPIGAGVHPPLQHNMAVGTFSKTPTGALQLSWAPPIPLISMADGQCEESDFVELPPPNSR